MIWRPWRQGEDMHRAPKTRCFPVASRPRGATAPTAGPLHRRKFFGFARRAFSRSAASAAGPMPHRFDVVYISYVGDAIWDFAEQPPRPLSHDRAESPDPLLSPSTCPNYVRATVNQSITLSRETINFESAHPGALVISLDFELLWGVRDHSDRNSYGRNVLGAREAIPALLDLFACYGIQATWATVGFLLCESKDELLARAPEYSYFSEVGPNEKSDPYYFGASLARQIVSCPCQELATHTFSHYYCLEPGQTENQFRADLAAAIALTRDWSLDVDQSSFQEISSAPVTSISARLLASLPSGGLKMLGAIRRAQTPSKARSAGSPALPIPTSISRDRTPSAPAARPGRDCRMCKRAVSCGPTTADWGCWSLRACVAFSPRWTERPCAEKSFIFGGTLVISV